MNAAPPARPKKRRLGRLVAPLIVIALLGGTTAFATVGAQAAAPTPAVLVVFTSLVELKHASGAYAQAATGAILQAGDSVRTGDKGRAAIQLPDGSVTRLDVDTEIHLSQSQLHPDGSLGDTEIDQSSGRTLSKVQHLVSGTLYRVHGRGASIEIRGTEFEVTIDRQGAALVQLFEGALRVSGAALAAGQQLTVSPQGAAGAPAPLAPDPNDIFTLEREAAAAQTATAGSVQLDENTAGPGQAVQGRPYGHPGGDLTAVLAYPGSLMRLDLSGPNGFKASQQGPPPVKLMVPAAAPGVYQAIATALDVPAGGENLVMSLGNDLPCVPGSISSGGARREAADGGRIAVYLAGAGISGAGAAVRGESAAGGVIAGQGSFKGAPLSFTAVTMAAAPNLVVVPTSTGLAGLPVAGARLASLAGVNLKAIGVGFQLDRVFACKGVLILEGRS